MSYHGIQDIQDWEAWKSKYMDPAALNLASDWELVVDDLGDNIYQYPLFNRKFCEELITLAEFSNNWTEKRHDNYPTNDV